MKKKNSATSTVRMPTPAAISNASPIALTLKKQPSIKISDAQHRALRVLFSGEVAFHVVGGKPTEWAWDFQPSILRELLQLGLADYMILSTGNRTWSLTTEGKDLCGELQFA
jgi:hypothetical protein